jgi:succinyl-CoA synthetase alpha subunit
MSVLVNKSTRVICQGITGSQGTFHSEQAIVCETDLLDGTAQG